MILKSIENPEMFTFNEMEKGQVFYGSNQRWYPTIWQRLSGCGPCASSNIFYYLTHNQSPQDSYRSKTEWVALMQELWKYVTPSIRGVDKMVMLYNPLVEFAQNKGIILDYRLCEIPKEVYRRPSLEGVIDFLEKALDNDAPIAFLNWNNGEVKNLDRWHWVTIIQLEFNKEKTIAYATILDEGRLKKVDLALWLRTTTLGGGLVYFLIPAREDSF